MSREHTGWVLSIYADERDGAVVWLLGDDGVRYRLVQPFETTFFIAGRPSRLESVKRFLGKMEKPPGREFTRRRDLYRGVIPVLAIRVDNPITQQRLFYKIKKHFKWLRFYNANIPFTIRYSAARDIFPMARVRVQIDPQGKIISIHALDSPWDLFFDFPPIRTMSITPDTDPTHKMPDSVMVETGDNVSHFSLNDERQLLHQTKHILKEDDPDLVIARWGDGWLFPYLMEIAERHVVDFNPSRDKRLNVLRREALTYHSYGDVHYRAPQTYLYGRWHVDPENTTMFGGFSLHAAIEMARVTCVAVQTAARNSPGSGFTAMQIREALRRGVLVPLHKHQTEQFKSALALNVADSGGLNYRPVVGLHFDVAELDFFSMYPSIMKSWNISGETVGVAGKRIPSEQSRGIHGSTKLTKVPEQSRRTRYVPQTKVAINQDVRGLVATVLGPLLEKRLAVKGELRRMDMDDPQRPILQAIADGLKWLGYVSFGYQGYKNNLFGNIAAHEAITAIGREMLTRAKEATNDLGYKVLAANTDSLFVQKPGANTDADFQELIDEIRRRTGLIIELEGIFQWLAFLPSKQNPLVGATNRYFGKFYACTGNSGSFKVRGLAQRRVDTPKWISDGERAIMELLATEPDATRLADCIPEAIYITRQLFADLDNESVPLVNLKASRKFTKEIHQYKGHSESAKAAKQLLSAGRELKVGQRISYVYSHGKKTDVYAWDLPKRPDYSMVDKGCYKILLLRVVHQILLPLGLKEEDLQSLVVEGVRQLELWPDELRENGYDYLTDEACLAEALFAVLQNLCKSM